MSGRVEVQNLVDGIISIPGRGIILAAGDTVPSDGALGYATSCVFHKLNGTTLDNTLYTNIGSQTSANFDAQVNS